MEKGGVIFDKATAGAVAFIRYRPFDFHSECNNFSLTEKEDGHTTFNAAEHKSIAFKEMKHSILLNIPADDTSLEPYR